MHAQASLVLSVFFLVVFPCSNGNPVSAGRLRRCERIAWSRECNSGMFRLPYTYIRLPNVFGHNNQNEVKKWLGGVSFRFNYALPERNCLKSLHFFVCTLYVPMCVDDEYTSKHPIKPCRDICEKAKNDCRTLMAKSIKANWSFPEFDCNQYERYDEGVCLMPISFNKSAHHTRNPAARNLTEFIPPTARPATTVSTTPGPTTTAAPTSPYRPLPTLKYRMFRKRDYMATPFDFAFRGRLWRMYEFPAWGKGWYLVFWINSTIFRRHYSHVLKPRSNVIIYSRHNCTSDYPLVHTCYEVGRDYAVVGFRDNWPDHPTQGFKGSWAFYLPEDYIPVTYLARNWLHSWKRRNPHGWPGVRRRIKEQKKTFPGYPRKIPTQKPSL